jgi:hypothetical protein
MLVELQTHFEPLPSGGDLVDAQPQLFQQPALLAVALFQLRLRVKLRHGRRGRLRGRLRLGAELAGQPAAQATRLWRRGRRVPLLGGVTLRVAPALLGVLALLSAPVARFVNEVLDQLEDVVSHGSLAPLSSMAVGGARPGFA